MKYIYQGQIKKLPQKWTFTDGKKTGNFDIMPVVDHITEGWLPITVINNESYNPSTHNRSAPTITTFADHAQLDYTLTAKDFNDLRYVKRRELREQGRQRVYIKYDQEAREDVFSGVSSNVQYKADRNTIKAHWQTIKQAILDANTADAIVAINTGEGSGLEWPVL